jgi:hypothetical protein
MVVDAALDPAANQGRMVGSGPHLKNFDWPLIPRQCCTSGDHMPSRVERRSVFYKVWRVVLENLKLLNFARSFSGYSVFTHPFGSRLTVDGGKKAGERESNPASSLPELPSLLSY